MRRRIAGVVLATCAGLLFEEPATEAAVLACDGEATCVLVVDDDAIAAEKTA